MDKVNKATGLPTIERGRGCYNCRHFENGEIARNHYDAKTAQDRRMASMSRQASPVRLADTEVSVIDVAKKAGEFCAQGHSSEAAVEMALFATGNKSPEVADAIRHAEKAESHLSAYTRAVAAGTIGMCMKGVPDSDFVVNSYLCGSWDGVDGSSVATAGHKLDKLPEEL